MDGTGIKSHSSSAQVGLKIKETKSFVSVGVMTLANGGGVYKTDLNWTLVVRFPTEMFVTK
jgi:hypothetical protein